MLEFVLYDSFTVKGLLTKFHLYVKGLLVYYKTSFKVIRREEKV